MFAIPKGYARDYHLAWGGSKAASRLRRQDKRMLNRKMRRNLNQQARVVAKLGEFDTSLSPVRPPAAWVRRYTYYYG